MVLMSGLSSKFQRDRATGHSASKSGVAARNCARAGETHPGTATLRRAEVSGLRRVRAGWGWSGGMGFENVHGRQLSGGAEFGFVKKSGMGMSITTKRGDAGDTDLLLGRRVAKSHPRLAAVGEVDELNAALGVARVFVVSGAVRAEVVRAQECLVALMGMLSAGPEQAERYKSMGFKGLEDDAVDRLTRAGAEWEASFEGGFKGWSMPGARGGAGAAMLEMARCVCRRAERAVISLPAEDQPADPAVTAWLNRLSDLLWLAARVEEREVETAAAATTALTETAVGS